MSNVLLLLVVVVVVVPFLCSRTVRCMNVLFETIRDKKGERDENYLLNLLEIERLRENERE